MIRFARFCVFILLTVLSPVPVAAQVSSTTVTADVRPTGNDDYDQVVANFLNDINTKAIGGVKAPAGSLPWQVSLQVSGIADASRAHFCGGAILDAKTIVTASHCSDGLTAEHILVVAGTHTIGPNERRTAVHRVIAHPAYDAASRKNDIALLILDNPLNLGDGASAVTPILPGEETALLPSQPVFVSGWGATREGGKNISQLMMVQTRLVRTDTCNKPLAYNNSVSDRMICAGERGKDSCENDSGGPLTTASMPGAKLVGIVSWGAGCGRAGFPGIYTRVSAFVPWMRACIGSPESAGCKQP